MFPPPVNALLFGLGISLGAGHGAKICSPCFKSACRRSNRASRSSVSDALERSGRLWRANRSVFFLERVGRTKGSLGCGTGLTVLFFFGVENRR